MSTILEKLKIKIKTADIQNFLILESLAFHYMRKFLKLLIILFYIFLLLEALEVLGEDN